MSDILVSIGVITYNQKAYIRECLDSILSQNVNFKYEILINDDCSTDGTAEIIKEYEQKYPEIIKPLYQTQNQYSLGKGILRNFILPRISGKYFALCEGDDYWTDSNKLQKQVDFLESHSDYSICFHPVKLIYEDNPNKTYVYPSKKTFKQNLDFERLLKWNFIQTNSVVYRWRFVNENVQDIIPNGILPGDWYLHLCHAQVGKIGALKEVMSVYRKHSGGIWYDTDAVNKNLHRRHGIKELKFYKYVYEKFANKSEEYLKNIYLPSFKIIKDNYYNFGDIDKLSEIKKLYPEMFEMSLQTKNPTGNKLKKYKKLYTYFLILSIILFVLNVIQFIF